MPYLFMSALQVEVYKAGRPDLRLLVVILTYDGSVEQQAFAASVEREVGGGVGTCEWGGVCCRQELQAARSGMGVHAAQS
jgi:hypothetical protein